jgi:hypothetical protein
MTGGVSTPRVFPKTIPEGSESDAEAPAATRMFGRIRLLLHSRQRHGFNPRRLIRFGGPLADKSARRKTYQYYRLNTLGDVLHGGESSAMRNALMLQ